MKISIEKIDPERAKELLARTRNRRLQPAYVKRLARDMESGDWRPNSMIQIVPTDAGDVLIDGQHRMAAVMASGIPCEFIVTHVDDFDYQQVIDVGRHRNLRDTLTMLQEPNAGELAAAISWLWRRQQGYFVLNYSPTIAEGLRLLQKHPGLRDSLQPVRIACRNLKIPGGLGVCLHYEMSVLDQDSANDFWDKLTTGLDLHERHPIHLLRIRLEANRASAVTKIGIPTIHALLVKAWNAYIRGDELGVLRWSRGGAKPEPFPQLEGPDDDGGPS